MKCVVFILNTLRIGGAEIQTVQLINNLYKKKVKVFVFSLDSNSSLKSKINKSIDVRILHKKKFLDRKVISTIITSLNEIKPDTLICVNQYSMLYGFLARLFIKKKIKSLMVMHTTIISNTREKLKNIIYKKLMNKMDSVIFVSRNQMQYWIKKYGILPARSRVIYNGIDIKHFSTCDVDRKLLRKKLGYNSTDIIIGINAVLRPEKNHENIIDAVQVLNKEGYYAKLLIIGDGPRRKFVEDYIKSKNMSEKVIITGFLEDVRPHLKCTDISVLVSSSIETFSIAILESMAMKKPIVMSDIGGANEQVEHGRNGMLYAAGDTNQLVIYLKHIIDKNLFKTMGSESFKKVKTHYTDEIMTNNYLEMI